MLKSPVCSQLRVEWANEHGGRDWLDVQQSHFCYRQLRKTTRFSFLYAVELGPSVHFWLVECWQTWSLGLVLKCNFIFKVHVSDHVTMWSCSHLMMNLHDRRYLDSSVIAWKWATQESHSTFIGLWIEWEGNLCCVNLSHWNLVICYHGIIYTIYDYKTMELLTIEIFSQMLCCHQEITSVILGNYWILSIRRHVWDKF